MEYDTTNIKKQFDTHKTGVKINEKHNVRVAFVENTVWPVR